jgi:hypothetical protein
MATSPPPFDAPTKTKGTSNLTPLIQASTNTKRTILAATEKKQTAPTKIILNDLLIFIFIFTRLNFAVFNQLFARGWHERQRVPLSGAARSQRGAAAADPHRHKRYGVGIIHLKLRQEGGEPVNYKRVERLYREERLQVRRRKRKKVPVSERQPLCRPSAPNEVWSMDFVFDRTADARVVKCLTIVDDATHESVGIEVERGDVARTAPVRLNTMTASSLSNPADYGSFISSVLS